jgi:hypothetical protein
MNVTQEGKSAVDDLREMGLVNGLKLTSEDFQPITAFQVSLKVSCDTRINTRQRMTQFSLSPQGLDVSRSIPRYFHDGVRALVCGPKPFHRELLQCVFDGEKFKLVSTGFRFLIFNLVFEDHERGCHACGLLLLCIANMQCKQLDAACTGY